jgi:hypothetical protein
MRDLRDGELERVSGGLVDPHQGQDQQLPGVPPPNLDPPTLNPDDFVCW